MPKRRPKKFRYDNNRLLIHEPVLAAFIAEVAEQNERTPAAQIRLVLRQWMEREQIQPKRQEV